MKDEMNEEIDDEITVFDKVFVVEDIEVARRIIERFNTPCEPLKRKGPRIDWDEMEAAAKRFAELLKKEDKKEEEEQ